MSSARRIGILGGTFDPVHIGHLHVASCAKQMLALDEVVLMPAGAPPHKPGNPITAAHHRFRMLELAIEGVDGMRISDLDIGSRTPSYTSDLLRRYRQQHDGTKLWFIVGADSLEDFHTWHEPESILQVARLAVAPRPGWDIPEILLTSKLGQLRSRTDVFTTVSLDVSSTILRQRLRSNQPVDWLIPDRVLRFIREEGLYG